MRLHWVTVLCLSIQAALTLPLDAAGEDPECEGEIRVHKNTVYQTDLGSDLKIVCPVLFCNNSAPTVLWFKLDNTTYVPVDVSSDSHIETDWQNSNQSNHGRSLLIFQNIRTSDTGLYKCHSGLSVGHTIKISVHGVESTAVTEKNVSEIPAVDDTLWPYIFRLIGIKLFVSVVMLICVRTGSVCKGGCRSTAGPSRRPSQHASHVYENDK